MVICFSICNSRDTILKGGVLTSVLVINSSCFLTFYLLGLLEPTLSFVLVKCTCVAFPDLVGEPPQKEHRGPVIVKEEEPGRFW